MKLLSLLFLSDSNGAMPMNPEYLEAIVLVWAYSVKLCILTKSNSTVVDRVLFLNFNENVSVSTGPVNLYS